jgi:hypothetical protein
MKGTKTMKHKSELIKIEFTEQELEAWGIEQAMRRAFWKTLCYISISDDPEIIACFRSFACSVGGEFHIEHVGPFTKLTIIPPPVWPPAGSGLQTYRDIADSGRCRP